MRERPHSETKPCDPRRRPAMRVSRIRGARRTVFNLATEGSLSMPIVAPERMKFPAECAQTHKQNKQIKAISSGRPDAHNSCFRRSLRRHSTGTPLANRENRTRESRRPRGPNRTGSLTPERLGHDRKEIRRTKPCPHCASRRCRPFRNPRTARHAVAQGCATRNPQFAIRNPQLTSPCPLLHSCHAVPADAAGDAAARDRILCRR